MSGPQYSIGHLCVSTVKAMGQGIADWVRERHLDFEAGIRYRSPAGRLYAYLWWLGLIFIQVVLILNITDGVLRYRRSVSSLARGEKYLAEQDDATAEACFDEALRSWPYSVAPYQYEGQLLLHRFFAGTEPKSRTIGISPLGTLAESHQKRPASVAGQLGPVLNREKLVQDGIAFLNIAIKLENQRTLPLIVRKQGDKISDAYYWRGRGRLFLGAWEPGISDFSNTIRIQPENANAYFYRACCHFALGKPDAANTDLEQAFTRDPTLRSLLTEAIPFRNASPESERWIADLSRQISNLRRDPSQHKELARLTLARGDAYLIKNDLEAAYSDYIRCLDLGENSEQKQTGGIPSKTPGNDAELRSRLALIWKLAK